MTPPRARASAIMVSSCLNDWNWSDSWHFHLRGLLSLGYKFRQNSGRNFSSVPDSGFFVRNVMIEVSPLRHFLLMTFTHRPISTALSPLRTEPNTIGEGLSITFEPLHLKEKLISR
jgi:hypothetical protein